MIEASRKASVSPEIVVYTLILTAFYHMHDILFSYWAMGPGCGKFFIIIHKILWVSHVICPDHSGIVGNYANAAFNLLITVIRSCRDTVTCRSCNCCIVDPLQITLMIIHVVRSTTEAQVFTLYVYEYLLHNLNNLLKSYS